MKIPVLLFFFFPFIILHSRCYNEAVASEKFRQGCIDIAEKYIDSQLDSTKKEISPQGIIMIRNSKKTYIIDPANIHTGLINEDNEEDGILTLDTFSGQYQTVSEHLIITSSEHKPMLNRVIESDMKILAIQERSIIAEVPEHARNSPLFNCPSCREIVKYRFLNGELIVNP